MKLDTVEDKLNSGQHLPISEALEHGNKETKEVINDFLAKLETGEISMCACMGPMYDEPFCPCSMKRKGLPMDGPMRKLAEAESKKQWAKGFEPGGFFYEMNRKADKNG